MRIQHNIPAMSSYRNYTNNTSALAKNLEKLSSGYRINRAGDDAAGLAISEKMRAQITGLEVAQKNAKDGISLVQTAEGALTEVHDMLNRMYSLAEQSANGTYDNDVDRVQLQKEVEQLRTEINRIADSSNFNGIKLLDGSLDAGAVTTSTAPSAISGITTKTYNPKGASDAFSSKFIIERPEAATKQINAEFVVSLDDVKLNNVEAGDKFSITVGGTKIEAELAANDDLAKAVTALTTKGGHAKSTSITDSAANATAANSNTAADFKDDADWKDTSKAGAYVEIDGHIWKMSAVDGGAGAGTAIKFEQVDFTTDKKNIKPDYAVVIGYTDKDAADATHKDLDVSGTVNRQVQMTKTGIAVGSSQQAQVETYIDFTKLKDGDTFNVGDKTYIFAIGKDSQYKATVPNGETIIDLTTTFAEESYMLDEDKQKEAMVKITETMKAGTSNTWSAGNQGVSSNVGTLTFQSLSTYTGDATGAADADKKYIAGVNANGLCDMRTEASVMKQFYSGRQESGAKLSFDVDVTKIKVGDTFTIDGKTFEFVDGAANVTGSNVAIDLSGVGISGGILSSQTATVMEAMKNAISGSTGALKQSDGSTDKYTVKYDGSTMTLESKDDATTPRTYENRTSAELKLPTVTTTGKSLTLQIGDTAESFNQMKVNVKDMHAKAMGIGDIDIGTQEGASAAMAKIKDAINYVSDVRGTLGATQNRLDHTINNLSVMQENIQDAESTIRDVDIAQEMMAYTKNSILVQSAQAMLAQANQLPQGVLQLLG